MKVNLRLTEVRVSEARVIEVRVEVRIKDTEFRVKVAEINARMTVV